MLPAADGDEESRTSAIGRKHARRIPGFHHISKEGTKCRHRVRYQDLRDFVPRGGNFAHLPVPGSQIHPELAYDFDQMSDVSGSSSDYQIPQHSSIAPAVSWNDNMPGSIKTSLRTSLRTGGNLGQNRLATGFHPQTVATADNRLHRHDVIEISDDSATEDDSEGGGIMLNVDDASRPDSSVDAETPAQISEDEDGEVTDDQSKKVTSSTRDANAGRQGLMPESCRNATPQIASQNKSGIASSPMFQVDTRRGTRILADLNPEELENQIRYTLFHLPRDQIDLSRPVICMACLTEGHTDQLCPRLFCSSCGGQTKHPSRLCPKRARCARCGDRGHNVGTCKAKLQNPSLEPCDFCGGADHVEASCTQRFFPARSEVPTGELQLWISCAQCGSKDHLAGDCPTHGSRSAPAWSLRAYSRTKIINLSLQTGTQAREKEAKGKGIRPEGTPIRGRGASSHNKYPRRGEPAQFSGLRSDDDDDLTRRIGGNRSTRLARPVKHDRFHEVDRGGLEHGGRDDHYRPRADRPPPSNDYDSYHPPPPQNEYRDRNGYREGRGYDGDRGYRNRRPRSRSRSPPRFDRDNWRPPLPREPPPAHVSLPARPAPPRSQQQPHKQSPNSSRKARRAGGKGRNGDAGGGVAVKPMPSAAQNAWNRGRL